VDVIQNQDEGAAGCEGFQQQPQGGEVLGLQGLRVERLHPFERRAFQIQ